MPRSIDEVGHAPRGLTIIEVVMASVVLAGLASAALSLVGASAAARRVSGLRDRAHWLARDLMNEILDRAYVDPESPAADPGVDSGEASGDSRLLFDDVDDYAGLEDDPAAAVDGVAIPGVTGWSRAVEVEWVTAAAPASVSGSDTGLRRITVTARFNGAAVLELEALKATEATP